MFIIIIFFGIVAALAYAMTLQAIEIFNIDLVYLMPIFLNMASQKIYMVTGLLGLSSCIVIIALFFAMTKRSAYGIEMLGKTRGFKNFFKNSRKRKNRMVA